MEYFILGMVAPAITYYSTQYFLNKWARFKQTNSGLEKEHAQHV